MIDDKLPNDCFQICKQILIFAKRIDLMDIDMKTKNYKGFDELQDKYFGELGTPERDQYEFELNMEMIGEKIKQLRLEKHLTQAQLGELIGVKRSQISKLEKGNHSATVSTIMKVFHAMKAKVKLRIETEDLAEFAF